MRIEEVIRQLSEPTRSHLVGGSGDLVNTCNWAGNPILIVPLTRFM